MALPVVLLQNLGYLSSGGESACPKRTRNRQSKFAPYRLEILTLRREGKSLAQILRHLTYKHPGADFPNSRSQLLRFIQKCRGASR